MQSGSKSEPHKTLVEALDYRCSRSTPLVKYRQYINSPTISAGSATVKIITRPIVEIRMSAGGGEYSVCGIEPYEIGRPNLPVEQVRLRVHSRLRKVDKWRRLSVLRFNILCATGRRSTS
jgi:hypothetical protein